jgi:hypothetical protein
MKPPLAADELRHLEHRWGVLCSFLDVVDDPAFLRAGGHEKNGRILRGCKDGAIATCRALCERFGLTIYSGGWGSFADGEPTKMEFAKKVRVGVSSASDEHCAALWQVLVAANKAVCHLDEKLIDHGVDEPLLVKAIELVRQIANAKLQDANLRMRLDRLP